ncbi:MAG: histidine phosphatase family protein [Lachnospiraceae bacterium]|nr:histidine phosphatase family protein [Lachnospiraceae bacterium]
MKLIWIRHGQTKGNQEKRYIGRTEEVLCPAGIAQIQENIRACQYPKADLVVCSPMKRCIQTAKLIYPDVPCVIEENLRECDFGRFEGKNYQELTGDPAYQQWIDSNGTLPFPEGETVEAFQNRTVEGFWSALKKIQAEGLHPETVAFVVHGGTIMSVLEQYGRPAQDYYAYQVKNGQGYCTEFDGTVMQILGKIL